MVEKRAPDNRRMDQKYLRNSWMANIFPHLLCYYPLLYIVCWLSASSYTLCNRTNRLSKCSALQRQLCLFALKLFLPLNFLCFSIFICSLCYCPSLFLSSLPSYWWTITMLFYLLCSFYLLNFLFLCISAFSALSILQQGMQLLV